MKELKTVSIALKDLPTKVRVDMLDMLDDIRWSTNEQYIGGASKATKTTWYNVEGEPVEEAYRVRVSFRTDNGVHFMERFFDDNCNEEVTLRQDMYFTPDELKDMSQYLDEQKERADRLNREAREQNLFPEVA